MSTEDMEIYLADRIIRVDEQSLRKAQAAWRGAIVRMKMGALKKTFEDIFHDIEEASTADPWMNGYLGKIWSENSILWKPYKKIIAVETCQDTNAADTEANPLNVKQSQRPEEGCEANCDVLSAKDVTVHNNSISVLSTGEKELKDGKQLDELLCVPDNIRSSLVQPSDIRMLDVSEDDTIKAANETSVWESVDITNKESESMLDVEEQRKQIVMELLWMQQAINSRKQYLQLKKQMS